MAKKPKLNTEEVAEYYGLKKNTLEIWRCKHKGPRYYKLGSRVLYDIDDLEEFFAARAVDTLESQAIAARRK